MGNSLGTIINQFQMNKQNLTESGFEPGDLWFDVPALYQLSYPAQYVCFQESTILLTNFQDHSPFKIILAAIAAGYPTVLAIAELP